jgi:hypothetical protein
MVVLFQVVSFAYEYFRHCFDHLSASAAGLGKGNAPVLNQGDQLSFGTECTTQKMPRNAELNNKQTENNVHDNFKKMGITFEDLVHPELLKVFVANAGFAHDAHTLKNGKSVNAGEVGSLHQKASGANSDHCNTNFFSLELGFASIFDLLTSMWEPFLTSRKLENNCENMQTYECINRLFWAMTLLYNHRSSHFSIVQLLPQVQDFLNVIQKIFEMDKGDIPTVCVERSLEKTLQDMHQLKKSRLRCSDENFNDYNNSISNASDIKLWEMVRG